jgi:hypothetical protein
MSVFADILHWHSWIWRRKHVRGWVVAPCSLVEVCQHFRGPCCLHHQGDLMMKALQPRTQPSSYSPPWEHQNLLRKRLLFSDRLVMPPSGTFNKQSQERWRKILNSVCFVWNGFIKPAVLLRCNVSLEWYLTAEKVQKDRQLRGYLVKKFEQTSSV